MALQQPSVNEDIQLVDNEKGIATHHETADILELKAEAQRAEDFEHKISFIESVKIYKKAVFWSVIASTTVVMEGFDAHILGNLWGLQRFQETYGSYDPGSKSYQVSAPWQAAISNMVYVGNIIGVAVGAYIVDTFGYRKSIIMTLVFLSGAIGLVAFSPNKGALLAGELLCGIPWGVFSTLSNAYASEVCPISLRGYLTAYVNLCWAIGQFIAGGILLGYSNHNNTQWAFRLPWSLQWIWPLPIGLIFLSAPESPWWLVRHNKLEEAEKAVRRLAASANAPEAKDTIAMMVRTNELEMQNTGKSRWIDCFKHSDLRRTEISCLAYACQSTCGLVFAGGYLVYFFETAGISASDAYKLSLGNTGVGFTCTCLSWLLINRFGRRSVYIGGLASMTLGMLIIGILAIIAEKGNSNAKWGQATLMLLWVVSYSLSIGPLAFTVVGETSSTRLRNKTIALSRATQVFGSLITGIITPYMLNVTAWNWSGKTAFFWVPLVLISTLWCYFRLPEMKGRSYYELDVLFERGVPARKFSKAVIETNPEDPAALPIVSY